MGVAHVKYQNCCMIMTSRECVLCVEPSKGGRPRSITHAQRQACARAITIGGLDNVVDVMNVLSKHLIVVVNVNIARRALHEACLGSSKK